MVGDDRALELVGRRVERPQLRKQNSQRLAWTIAGRSAAAALDEFLDVADPFGGGDTELRQMTRKAFTLIVHCLISSSSGSCLRHLGVACWSSLLTATKRMFGRDIASQIAAASAASFLPRLT